MIKLANNLTNLVLKQASLPAAPPAWDAITTSRLVDPYGPNTAARIYTAGDTPPTSWDPVSDEEAIDRTDPVQLASAYNRGAGLADDTEPWLRSTLRTEGRDRRRPKLPVYNPAPAQPIPATAQTTGTPPDPNGLYFGSQDKGPGPDRFSRVGKPGTQEQAIQAQELHQFNRPGGVTIPATAPITAYGQQSRR